MWTWFCSKYFCLKITITTNTMFNERSISERLHLNKILSIFESSCKFLNVLRQFLTLKSKCWIIWFWRLLKLVSFNALRQSLVGIFNWILRLLFLIIHLIPHGVVLINEKSYVDSAISDGSVQIKRELKIRIVTADTVANRSTWPIPTHRQCSMLGIISPYFSFHLRRGIARPHNVYIRDKPIILRRFNIVHSSTPSVEIKV